MMPQQKKYLIWQRYRQAMQATVGCVKLLDLYRGKYRRKRLPFGAGASLFPAK